MTPHISDRQYDLLEHRSAAAGVDRRTFLKIAAALAALGPAGFNTRPASAAPTLAPGEKLAKDQTLRLGRRGLVAERPVEPRLQQGSVLRGGPGALGRPHEVHRQLRAGALRGEQGGVERGRLGVDVHHPQGFEVVGRQPLHRARLRVLLEAPARPRDGRPLLIVPVRHQERRGVQQEAGHRSRAGRRPRQGRLDARGDPGGAPRLLPGPGRVPGGAARPQGVHREVRRQVDGSRQHRLQRPLRAGVVGAQQGHGAPEEQALLRRQGHDPRPRRSSPSSRWPRGPCPTRTTRST